MIHITHETRFSLDETKQWRLEKKIECSSYAGGLGVPGSYYRDVVGKKSVMPRIDNPLCIIPSPPGQPLVFPLVGQGKMAGDRFRNGQK